MARALALLEAGFVSASLFHVSTGWVSPQVPKVFGMVKETVPDGAD